MLSEIIKKKVEDKAGIKIRYSRDCEILAEKIYSECNCRLSASTIRRLFGFIQGTKEVRLHTLDVISNYLSYSSWDELIQTLNKEKSNPKIITELKASTLKIGDLYSYSYKPNTEVTIEYIGKLKFKAIVVKNSQLNQGDIFKVSVISLHHPLFILEVERQGEPLGKMIEAKVSGITSIRKL